VIVGVADPGTGAFLTPGSGRGKKSGFGSEIRIRDEQPGSYFLELRNHFFGIRDGKNEEILQKIYLSFKAKIICLWVSCKKK
jgi:hypothetical protein